MRTARQAPGTVAYGTLLWIIVPFSVAVFSVSYVQRSLEVNSIEWFLIPVIWGTCALVPVICRRMPWPALGLRISGLRASLWLYCKVTLGTTAVLVLAVLVARRYKIELPFCPTVTLDRLVCWSLYQLLYVAVGEEVFFQGYAQDVLLQFGKLLVCNRASIWCSVGITGFLFALAHVIVMADPAAILFFFPGLLFAWLRHQDGKLLTPILSHATCNISFAVVCNFL